MRLSTPRRGSPPAARSLLLVTMLACGAPERADDTPADGTRPGAATAVDSVASLAPPPKDSAITVGQAFPIDEADADPGFLAFRTLLLEAVRARDSAFVLRILDPDIKLSFGGEQGVADFRTTWRPDSAGSELWPLLEDLLTHGGRFVGDSTFYAPYTFNALPDSLDAFTHAIAADSAVPVRAAPQDGAAVVARLRYHIVRVDRYYEPGEWVPLPLVSGDTGYVAARDLRSPVGYRAGFAKRGGRWYLVFLLAGD